MSALIGTWLLLFLGGVAIQATLIPVITIFGVEPDIPQIILFFFALTYGITPAIFTGFLLGLLQDIYSPSLVGQNALAKTITGFFMGIFNQRVMRTDPLIKLFILFLAFTLHDCVIWLVEIVKHDVTFTAMWSSMLRQSLPRSFYSMVIVACIYLWQAIISPSSLHN
jgi:rod shape-determining protein MreD